MRRTTSLSILAVALLLLGFVCIFERDMVGTQVRQSRQNHLVKRFDPGTVRRMGLVFADGTRVAVKTDGDIDGKDGSWHVTEPFSAPADPLAITAMLSAIDYAIVKRRIDDATQVSAYGLASPEVVVRLETESGSLAFKIGSTDPSGTLRYVAMEGDPRVYAVDGDFLDVFQKRPLELRHRHIFVPSGQITDIQIDKADEPDVRLVLRNTGTEWEVLWKDTFVPARVHQVKEIIHYLTEHKVQHYVDDEVPDGSVTVTPKATIRITCDGGQTHVIVMGQPCDDKATTLRVDDGPVACVDRQMKTIMQRPVTRFVETRPVGVALEDVAKIRIQRNGASLSLQRGADIWTTEDAPFALDQVQVEQWLKSVLHHDAVLMDAPTAHPLVATTATIEVTTANGNRYDVSLGKTASGEMGIQRDRDSLYLTPNTPEWEKQVVTDPLYFREKQLKLGHVDTLERVEISGLLEQTLEKKNGEWLVTHPVSAPVDTPLLAKLKQLVTQPTVTAFFDRRGPTANRLDDTPLFVIRATFFEANEDDGTTHQTGSQVLHLRVFDTAEDTYLFAEDISNSLFTVDKETIAFLWHPLVARTSLQIVSEHIDRMELAHPQGTAVWEKIDDRWQGQQCKADSRTVQQAIINLGAVRAAYAKRFGNAVTHPLLTVTLHGTHGTPPAILVFGPGNESHYFARREGLDITFAVAPSIVTDLLGLCP